MSDDDRHRKVLAFLHEHRKASALEIGGAAVCGERGAHRESWHSKEAIGLSIAFRLMALGLVKPTRGNQFELSARQAPK